MSDLQWSKVVRDGQIPASDESSDQNVCVDPTGWSRFENSKP